jgi:hypothetical protein
MTWSTPAEPERPARQPGGQDWPHPATPGSETGQRGKTPGIRGLPGGGLLRAGRTKDG